MTISSITTSDVLSSAPRFWKRVLSGDPALCWPWLLRFDRDGYGLFSLCGVPVMAHRVSWAIHNKSALPHGMVVMHTCDNPRCCNPLHLRLGSQIENLRDRDAKGRTPAGRSPMTVDRKPPDEVERPADMPPIRLERDRKTMYYPIITSGDRLRPRSNRSVSDILADLMAKKAAKRIAKEPLCTKT